ncbi:unnamed protein product [Urochloa humidicola]
MNQCVPSWDLDDPAALVAGGGLNNQVHAAGAHRGAMPAGASAFAPVVVPMSDQYYEVAELTWQKGNISSHGLLNRPPPSSKFAPAAPPSQLQSIGGGGGGSRGVAGDHETLEAVVGEAAARSHFLSQQPAVQHPAPWLGVARAGADALVPCAATTARVAAAADVGDAAADDDDASRRKRARVVVGDDGVVCASQGSAAAPGRRGESAMLTLDGCGGAGADDLCGFTTTTNNSTSLERDDKGSPDTENTSIGGGASDSRCFSRRSQRDGLCDEAENVVINGEGAVRSSISTKRSRAAAIHNESERKRRDRINQKMKTLQKLVPNSSKTDKASMLDEVIDYLKQLQAQVQVMSRMSSMMMPMAMPQLHQMSVMAQMAHMAQMAQMAQGMINMGSLAQPGYAGLTPPMMPPFVPAAMSWDPTAVAAAASTSAAGVVGATDRAPQPAGAVPDAFSAFLACQAPQNGQQPGSMEAYNKMVALYQKMSQQQQQGQPSNSSKQ